MNSQKVNRACLSNKRNDYLKPTISFVRPAMTQISLRIRALVRVLADRVSLLQHPGYQKRDKRVPLPYWVDLQADMSLFWLHRIFAPRSCLLSVTPLSVLCILHHWGVQLILAYSWARPAILVVGKGRGGMFLFLLFLHFHSCSSFFPVPLFHLLYSLFYFFSPFLWETTQNDPQGLTCR